MTPKILFFFKILYKEYWQQHLQLHKMINSLRHNTATYDTFCTNSLVRLFFKHFYSNIMKNCFCWRLRGNQMTMWCCWWRLRSDVLSCVTCVFIWVFSYRILRGVFFPCVILRNVVCPVVMLCGMWWVFFSYENGDELRITVKKICDVITFPKCVYEICHRTVFRCGGKRWNNAAVCN